MHPPDELKSLWLEDMDNDLFRLHKCESLYSLAHVGDAEAHIDDDKWNDDRIGNVKKVNLVDLPLV